MKRLRYYFNHIKDHKTSTYFYDDGTGEKSIYDGECIEILTKPNGEMLDMPAKIRNESTFWNNEIAYTINRTNELALDRPTVTIAIPIQMLGISDVTPAVADHCLRRIKPYFYEINAKYSNKAYSSKARPDKRNGKFIFQEDLSSKVMIRNTAYFSLIPAMDYKEGKNHVIYFCPYEDSPPDVMCLCIRMEVQLPYLNLNRAKRMLLKYLPEETERFIKEFNHEDLNIAIKLEQQQQTIREFLRNGEYCAFIANGSILARERTSDKPAEFAIAFQSPKNHEIEVAGIKGMGIKRGITVITGGGYSGKSTILNAISAGIYNHIKGDGREFCITDETAVTITAEDGRSVSNVNISPFIKWIPNGDPEKFSTTHASGSTSQGANIMEAISLGAKLLLIDEDRSATNFMIRDGIMKRLIEKEPITPFTDRVNQLAEMGVATILVIGGSGEYLSIADDIFMMDEYIMSEATGKAKSFVPQNEVCTEPTISPVPHKWDNERILSKPFSAYPQGISRELLSVSDTGFIVIGDERIDIRNLHDIATNDQVHTLAFILRHLANAEHGIDDLERMALAIRGLSLEADASGKETDIILKVQELYSQIQVGDLNLIDTALFTTMPRFMELPRQFEVLAAINRMRYVKWGRSTKQEGENLE